MTAAPRKDQKGRAPRSAAPAIGQGDMSRIPKVDLDLHGDAIGHWQDEPQPASGAKGDKPADGQTDRKR